MTCRSDDNKINFAVVLKSSRPEWVNLLPKGILQVLQDVMEFGELHGKTDLRDQGMKFHVSRAERHIGLYFVGDESEDHIEHAFCRLMMATAIKHGEVMKEDPDGKKLYCGGCGKDFKIFDLNHSLHWKNAIQALVTNCCGAQLFEIPPVRDAIIYNDLLLKSKNEE